MSFTRLSTGRRRRAPARADRARFSAITGGAFERRRSKRPAPRVGQEAGAVGQMTGQSASPACRLAPPLTPAARSRRFITRVWASLSAFSSTKPAGQISSSSTSLKADLCLL